jgi:predicted DNA-binding transcriptional regulator YafY
MKAMMEEGRRMRADRLVQIMLLLQTSGGMTTKQLAVRLEVSERTIARDMEALSAAGVPVYAQRGAMGGWRLTEGYRSDWAGLRKDELLSLLASEPQRHLTDLGLGDAYETAVLKMLAASPPAQRRDIAYMRQRVYVDAAGWHPSGEEVPVLPALQEAVWEGRELCLLYAAAGESQPQERVVSPLGLVLKGSLWYLVAVRDGQEPHSYRVSRISGAVPTGAAAARPDGFDLAAYWERSVQRFRGGLPRYWALALVHASARARLEQTRYVRVAAWLRPGEGAAAGATASAERGAHSAAAGELGAMASDGGAMTGGAGRPDGDGAVAGELGAMASGLSAGASGGAWGAGRHAGGTAVSDATDWLPAELEFQTLESACDIALSFGGRLIILAPAELRATLRDAVRELAMLYAEP